MNRPRLTLLVASLFVVVTFVVAFASPAVAGSDSPTPYTVTAQGITFPAPLEAHGHVNVRLTNGSSRGLHLDPNNGHPGGAWIGATFLPWSALGITGGCVSWVQVAGYNAHYGEGGQSPVCLSPTPTPEPTDTPTAEPQTPPACVAIPEKSETERTEWVTETPGEDWTKVDTRTVIDSEAVEQVERHEYKRWIEPTYKTVENPDYKEPRTEVIPPVGTPTIVIENEDYVPAVPEVAEVSHIEKKYEKAIFKTEYQYIKQVKGDVQVKTEYGWKRHNEFGWETWSGNLTKWSEQKSPSILASGPHHAQQGGEWTDKGKRYRKITNEYRYFKTGVTRDVATGRFDYSGWKKPGEYLSAPWVQIDERRIVTQKYVPGTPAVGTPTIEVTNPDYVPGKTIEHPAVGNPTIEVIDVPGYDEFQWFDTIADREDWTFVRTELVTEGKEAATHEEFVFEKTTVTPGRDCPPVPETRKPVEGITEGLPDCVADTVTITKTVTTFASPTWDQENWTWIEDTTGTKDTTTSTRPLTEDERKTCPPPVTDTPTNTPTGTPTETEKPPVTEEPTEEPTESPEPPVTDLPPGPDVDHPTREPDLPTDEPTTTTITEPLPDTLFVTGVGTTLAWIAGGLLALGAVLVMVTRRRNA